MFEFLVHALTIAAIYGMMALGLHLQAGYAGLMNFGHIAFAGLGAYATGISIHAGLGAPLGLAVGVGLAVVLGWCISRLGRQLAADYWAIVTLAIAEIMRTIANNEGWLTGGAQGISALPVPFGGLPRPYSSLSFLLLVILLFAACAWVCQRLGNGRLGRALRLMREEPKLAGCVGYNLTALKSRALMAAGAVTAVGGSLYAQYMSFVGPDYLLAAETFLLWTMLMIGGMGNTAGVVVGVLLVQGVYTAVPFFKDVFSFNSDMTAALRLGLIGVLLLACLLWRSQGLVPEKVRKIPS